MAEILVSVGARSSPLHVRDLSGRRVRMTYHRRDPADGHVLGLTRGQRGPFDVDVVVTGVIVPVFTIVPGCATLWGVLQDSGEVAFAIFLPTDPVVSEWNLHTPSQWDGRRNGTWELVEEAE